MHPIRTDRKARADSWRKIVEIPAKPGEVAVRIVHACGMIDVSDHLEFSDGFVESGIAALRRNESILCDGHMTAAGISKRFLPAESQIVTSVSDAKVALDAGKAGTTRSAQAVDSWKDMVGGSIVAVGNAPTALFRLLELLDEGVSRPAAIIAFPVGFVGAAESKAELVRNSRGCDYLVLPGRRGGSAMASAAINALCILAGSGSGRQID